MTNKGNRALFEIIDSERQLREDLWQLKKDVDKEHEEAKEKYEKYKDNQSEMYGMKYLSKMDTLYDVQCRLLDILLKGIEGREE